MYVNASTVSIILLKEFCLYSILNVGYPAVIVVYIITTISKN